MKKSRTATVLAVVALIIYAYQIVPADSQERIAPDESQQVKVITTGGFSAAYDVLAPQFELATGIELVTARGTSTGGPPNSIPYRLSQGEVADVVILSRSPLDELADLGEVRPATRVDLVCSSIGMAVRSGAAKPDISSREALIDTLLAAESIGYSASISGTYLSTELFPRLGIWEQIQSKSKRIVGDYVGNAVARGEVEIGFQQISEILPIVGADYVGPIPVELQRVTTFSAGITARAVNLDNAQRFVEFLSSEAVAATIAATGLVPVVTEPAARAPCGR
jgi:molybdate transport system substrate-binding protein